jgi:membrane dipeptidase
MMTNLSRRDAVKAIAHVGATVLAAPMLNIGRFQLFAHSPAEYSERAIRLVRESLVIDMLSPITLNFPLMAQWTANPERFTAADFQKYKDSGINVFHIAVGTGGPDAYRQPT